MTLRVDDTFHQPFVSSGPSRLNALPPSRQVFLADTGNGAISGVNLATRATQSSALFTLKDHINTVAVVPTPSG